jgi:hypothetical protein
LRTGFRIDFQAPPLCLADFLRPFGRAHVEYLDRHINELRQRDDPLDRLPLYQRRFCPGMIAGIRQTGRFQPGGHPLDRLMVFGVDHHEGLVFARRRQHRQHLAVGQETRLIGQEHLQ